MSSSVVVTGGGRGIGRAIVECLLTEGRSVVIVERDEDAISWVHAHPHASRLGVVLGSAAADDIADEAAETAERLAPLTGWVNNAAVFRDAALLDGSGTDFLSLVNANLLPVIAGTRAAVAHFLHHDRAGAIVNMSSHQAGQSVPGAAPYSTAKAAIEGFTRSMAVDYGRRGIRVNVVAPGSIRTERYDGYLDSLSPEERTGAESLMTDVHPVGRMGSAAEVAAAVAFLLSAGAGFIHGATIPVDGGRTILAHDPEQK